MSDPKRPATEDRADDREAGAAGAAGREKSPAAPGALQLGPLDDDSVVLFTVPAVGESTVGRDPGCTICLYDRQVSKCHAKLARGADGWTVTDLGSRNGTAINEDPLAPETSRPLRSGDVLGVGPVLFRVRVTGAVSASRRPAASSTRYETRATIFPRLRADSTTVRDLGWKDFRDRYAPVIVGFARNAGLPSQDADDVLQEVMLNFFRLASDFEYDPRKGRFRGYLKTATLNVIRKRVRRQRPQAVREEWLVEQAAVDDSHWDTEWEEQLFRRAASEAEQRVDAKTFEAFDLYAQRGVPAEEVARRLELTINGVHQAKARVLRMIREIVDRLRSDEG